MQEQKINMKKRILVSLTVLSLVFSFFVVGSIFVKADWSTTGTIVNVENVALDTEQGGIVSSNSVIFYEEELDRWYILYVKDIESDDFQPYYSYSDSGNLSSWNNGGAFYHLSPNRLRRSTWQNLAGGYVSWVYDNENNLGHIVAVSDHTATTYAGFRYSNFTINIETGAVEFGSAKDILALTGTTYVQVDICLSQNNLPIIALGGSYNSNYYSYAWICDSIDGYNGNWQGVYYQPQYSNSQISVIPTGNTSCIIINSDNYANNPLRYYSIDFGITSNSSGQGTIFSENSLWRYDLSNNIDVSTFGVAYNSTHGLITYCAVDYNAYAFLFDFETLTKTDEYLIDNTGDAGHIKAFNGGVFETNEAFVTYYTTRFATENHDVRISEYHNALYEGYFAINGAILDDYTTDYSSYSGFGMNTARMTDGNGINLIMLHGIDGQYIAVTYWNPEGEYVYIPEGEIEADFIDYNLLFILGGVASILTIMYIITIAKQELD